MKWVSTSRAIALAVLTPLLEKNVVKMLAVDAPVVFSMSRIIVCAFAVGMLRQLWRAGVAGWPEATLAIAIVLALPILGALDRVKPEQVIDLARSIVGRIGVGEIRRGASLYTDEPREPWKHDDHREDR